MIWTNRSFLFISICSGLYGRELSVKDSYDALFHSSDIVHATLHLNNIIRQGANGLTDFEKSRLSEIGLSVHGDQIIALKPTNLIKLMTRTIFGFITHWMHRRPMRWKMKIMSLPWATFLKKYGYSILIPWDLTHRPPTQIMNMIFMKFILNIYHPNTLR